MRFQHYIFLLLLFFVRFAYAQTVALPDANMRDKLITTYPQVMQGNELDITEAAALTGMLDLANSNISNAEGIQYFTSITTLRLSGNQLGSLPDFSGITGLVNFYASDNELTELPDFSTMANLRDFQVMDNQLTELPDFSNNNQLRSLYCSNNQLQTLADLSHLPELQKLVMGNNPVNEVLDFSFCPNLTELHIHKIDTDTIIGLAELTQLEVLYAWENSIRDLSGLNENTVLKQLVVFHNALTDLPVLDNKPGLEVLDINSCYLTFEDIAPVLNLATAPALVYSPQKNLAMEDRFFRAENARQLAYPADNALAGNSYTWYKNGALISSSEIVAFNPVSFSDSGTYYLEVSNSSIPELTLLSDSFYVHVDPCLEFSYPVADVLDKDCSKGYSISLADADMEGGTRPFRYTLKNETYEKTFTDESMEGLPAGRYKITVTDAKQCSVEDQFLLEHITGCDPVLTPNGDGVADTFFIDEEGLILIYDYNRKLIKTLTGPTVWDGTDEQGDLVEVGYYIIIPEKSKSPVYITIIR